MEEQKTPGMRIRALREMKFQSIRNLAEQAGVSDYSTFLRTFQNTFHMSPREFR